MFEGLWLSGDVPTAFAACRVRVEEEGIAKHRNKTTQQRSVNVDLGSMTGRRI